MIENVDLERTVLSAAFLDDGALDEIVERLDVRDFYRPQHQLVFSAIVYLTLAGDPVDLISVTQHLKDRRKLTAAGGAAYISELTTYSSAVGQIDYYVSLLREETIRRELQISLGLLGTSLETGTPVTEVLDRMMSDVIDLAAFSAPGHMAQFDQIGNELVAGIMEGVSSTARGFSTGFPVTDSKFLNLKPTDLLVFAARPSMGKSALAINMMTKIAKANRGVLFCSLEMSAQQVGRRILSIESGIPYTKLMTGMITDMERDHVIEVNSRLRPIPLTIDDASRQTVAQIRTKARRLKARGDLDLLVVDYLQLMCDDPDDRGQISAASSGLKAIAKDLEIPVIAISQLNRHVEHRDSQKPQLSDLRGSGQIEQDADLVAFLHRPMNLRTKMSLIVAKHRNGPLGEIEFKFDPSTTAFSEIGENGDE